MATTVSDTVVLPDGSVPSNGYIYFTCLEAPSAGVLPTVVQATISSTGTFTASLLADSGGTPYAVRVEYWSTADNRLIPVPLPNVVPTGSGTATLSDIAAVPIPANATSTYRLKQGATFDASPQAVDDYGRPIDLTGITITSSILGPDGVRRAITVGMLDATEGILEFAASTSNWPLGTHLWDIRFTDGVTVDFSRTVTVILEEAITL